MRSENAIDTAPQRNAWGELFPRTGIVPLEIGATLAVATALECHSASRGINSFASWTLSLLYGAALWIWWVVVVELLWRAGKRWPSTLRVSLASSAVHLLVAVGAALLHLGF